MSEQENKELENEVKKVNEAEVNGINISEDVVVTIAGKATSEVKGVASMNGGIAGGLSEMFGKKSFSKGVKVQITEKDAVIDLYIIVDYGTRIPDIAFEIQNRVKTAVENMTGLRVLEVNIHVQGVNLPKEDKNKEENDTQE